MAARCRQRLEQDTIEFKAGRQVSIPIPQDRPIRRITTTFTIKVDAGVTAPTGRKNSHYLNLIKAIILDLNAGDQKLFHTGKSKYFQTLFELGVTPDETKVIATPAANGSATYKITYNFDFAQNPQTLSDFTALLNAPALGSAKLIVDWGVIGDIFGTVNTATVNEDDTKVEITYVEVFDNGQEGGTNLNDALAQAIDIRETVDTPKAIDKRYRSYGTDEIELAILPVPALILTHMFFTESNTTDGNPLLSDSVLTHFKIENIRGAGEPIILDDWNRFKATLKMDYRLAESAPAGVGYINWVDQRQGGLRNGAVDALKMRMLTAAPTANKKNGVTVVTKFIVGAVPLQPRVP